MTQILLPFLTAIALSAIAAFYSVIGLAQIFPGSFWPIVIMGSVLEIAKLVTVSWLYNNWNETIRIMRYYFLSAIILLMLITSMGIFGYLSRAHIESNIVVGANSVQLRTLETQEKIARERLDYLLKKAGEDPEKISRRTDQAIQETQRELKKLSEEKLPLLTEENKLAAEIGPIKYIAELLYTKDDPDFIDKAVRVVILIIIVVFDPLAVLLLIAANQSYKKMRIEEKPEVKKAIKKKKVDISTAPSVELFTEDSEVIPKSKITQIGEI
jgi:hypothetical protein